VPSTRDASVPPAAGRAPRDGADGQDGRDVQVVEARLGDPVHADALVAILDAYAREPAGGGVPLPPDTRERLVPALRERHGTLVLLALAEGVPRGAAVAFEGFSTFSARPLWNLHDLAVLPAWRGRGLGTALVEALAARARERGACKLTLEVREDNRGARALYRRLGFGDFAPGGDASPTFFLERRL